MIYIPSKAHEISYVLIQRNLLCKHLVYKAKQFDNIIVEVYQLLYVFMTHFVFPLLC